MQSTLKTIYEAQNKIELNSFFVDSDYWHKGN